MTPEELRKLTPEERARLDEAEQKALRILKYQMNEGARPRRHKQIILLILALVIGLVAVSWIAELLFF